MRSPGKQRRVPGVAEEQRQRPAAVSKRERLRRRPQRRQHRQPGGGWTIQWQGASGDIIPGTTILEGIKEVAPQATVTYSIDASAPMTGADVGVVVVGETPYAEGFGVSAGRSAVSAPRRSWREVTLLQPGDKAVIDNVCDAIETCVLVVVSFPQVLTDQLGKMDALVASWLPGSEGAGAVMCSSADARSLGSSR